jgi:hypothetical protein
MPAVVVTFKVLFVTDNILPALGTVGTSDLVAYVFWMLFPAASASHIVA